MALLLIFLLNLGISAWNAYASGAYWTESKLIGGWTRFMTWCGLVMAACGWTWCYLVVFAFIGAAAGKLTPEDVDLMLKMGYLVIILPVVGSGFAITGHSLAQAYRERSFGSIARAGWNTYAQARNTYGAVRQAPGIWKEVSGAFSSKRGRSDNKGAGALLLAVLVIVALSAGVLTTIAIAMWADKRVALDLDNEFLGKSRA
jgi:hypothetical protein